MAVILDVTSTPQTFTSGNWPLTELNTGIWQLVVTPTNASANAHHNDFRSILVASDQGGLWFAGPAPNKIGLYNASSGAAIFEQTVTWAALAAITITVNMGTGSVTIAGCLTGNGTFGFTPANGFSAGTLGAGRYPPDTFFDLAGTVSDVDDTSAGGSNVDPSGIASSETFGTAIIQATRFIDPSGITTSYISGSNVLDTGIVLPLGLFDPELLELAWFDQQINLGRFDEDLVDELVVSTLEIIAEAISSSESFGTQVLEADTEIIPSGISSSYGSGTALIDTGSPFTLGVHGIRVQTFGSGSTPARVTLSVTAGSFLLMGRAGKSSDLAIAPSDGTDTWIQYDITREYPNWSGYGHSVRFCRNTVTGSKNIDCSVTSFDEHTVSILEIIGTNLYIQEEAHTSVANGSGSTTHASGTVNTSGPAVILAHWWGAGPVGSGDHIVSASNGFTVLESFGTDDPNGYVQHYLFYKIVATAGAYNTTFTQTPSQGAESRLIAIQSASLIPAGIVSQEIFGSQSVNAGQPIDSNGIATAESFGTAKTENTVQATGVATAESFGTAKTENTVQATGVATAESFGIAKTENTVQAIGVTTGEAFGSGNAQSVYTAIGVVSGEAFGSNHLGQYVTLTGISSAYQSGTGSFNSNDFIIPVGISTAELFGSDLIQIIIQGVGITTGQLFGSNSFGLYVNLTGINSAYQTGNGSFNNDYLVDPTGIASQEAFGIGSTQISATLTGIASAEVFGLSNFSRFVNLTGIMTNEAFGSNTLTSYVSPIGILSSQAFGSNSFDSINNISHIGIVSQETFGTGHLPRYITLIGIASGQLFGSAVIADVDTEPVEKVFRVLLVRDYVYVTTEKYRTILIEDPVYVKIIGEYPMKIRQNDTLPEIRAKAFKKSGVYDLTIFTSITFTMDNGAGTVISGAATGDAQGNLAYTWAVGNTAIIGRYSGVFRGTTASGKTQTLPTEEDIQIEVIPFPSG